MRAATKLIVFASAAAGLSSVLLGVTQYRSLLSIRDQTKVAIEADLRETLQSVGNMVGAAVEADAQTVAAQALSGLEGIDFSREDDDTVGARLSVVIRTHPEAIASFIFDFQSKPPRAHSFSPDRAHHVGMYQWAPNSDIYRAIELHNEAEHPFITQASQPKVFTQQESCNFAAKTCSSHLYIFRNFANGNFAALILDPNYVRAKFLARMLPESARYSKYPGSDLDFVVAVLDENRNEIYTTAPGFRNYQIYDRFGIAFPHWQLAIGYKNGTIEAIAKTNLNNNLCLTLILFVILAIGIALVLRAAAEEMRLAELKSAFVANVSHELKTPLSLIRLFAETLELGRVETKEKVGEYCGVISRESQRLTHLIDNILDFSQMEAGHKGYHFVPANLSPLIETVVGGYRDQIEGLGFTLTTHIEPNMPPVIIDAAEISQVLLNLLDNAVKYSRTDKRITIRAESRGREVAIVIADHGIGIAPSEHERIFEKFYRIGTGTVHATKGSGLGLTLVRHIVESHGGQIVVNSALGKGSRFTVLIPQCAEVKAQGKHELEC